jgi:hypothetical protein
MSRQRILIIATGALLCFLTCKLLLPRFNPPMPAVQYLNEMKKGIAIICIPIVALTILALNSTRKK